MVKSKGSQDVKIVVNAFVNQKVHKPTGPRYLLKK